MTIESGLVNIRGEKVTGKDIENVIRDTVEDTYDNTRELVSCLPISFTVDDEASVINPLKESGEKLFLKAVVATSPKEEVYPFINIVRSVGIDIVDILRGALPMPLDYKELSAIGKVAGLDKAKIYSIWEGRLRQVLESNGMNIYSNSELVNAMLECAKKHVD